MFKPLSKALLLIVLVLVLVIAAILIKDRNRDVTPVSSSFQPIRLRIGYVPDSVNHAPVMIAQDKQLFSQRNIEVEIVTLASGKEVAQALAAGQIDIGSGGITNFLTAISQDVPMRIIVPVAASPSQVYVRPAGSIQNFTDLKGKQVGTKPGSGDSFAFLYALRKEGIAKDSVVYVDILNSVRPTALMNKQIDAAVGGEYEDELYKEAGAVLLPAWAEQGYSTTAFPRTVLAATTSVLDQRPDDVAAFVQTMIDSQRFMKESPQESAALVAEHINSRSSGAAKLTTEGVQKAWEVVRYALWSPDDVWQDMASLAFDVEVTKRPLSLTEFFDQRFATILRPAQYAIYGSSDSQ